MYNLIVFITCLVWINVHSASFLRESGKTTLPYTEKPHFKYTVDELLNAHFPERTSDDVFLDICKSGKDLNHYNIFFNYWDHFEKINSYVSFLKYI